MEDPAKREAALLNAALELSVVERAAYLDRTCAGDAALRQRIDALIEAHEQATGFLEPPTARLRPTVRLDIPLTEKAGDRIGRYKLLQQIGEGGCGVVYMAEQEEPVRRRVALKVIKLGMDTKQVIARFEAERQALALMDHPNIAKVLDAGTTETGRPYFVMELVRGVKITEFCDESKLTTEGRLKLFVQVCQAIQHAHQKGIIHRDIKPSNILVTISDAVPLPKVIDFGIAKATAGRLTDQTVFTAFEQFIGTPAYMSPEQAVMTSQDIDTRSDIYSLGVLLYELLTGKTPFDARELMKAGFDEMRRIIREQEPPCPSTRLSTMLGDELTTTATRRQTAAPKLMHVVRGDLDWIVMKCLEKDRTRRYETANGLAADLGRHLNNEPVVARPSSVAYKFQKALRRNKLAFAAVGSVAAALVCGIMLSAWQMMRANQEARRAVAAEALAVQRQGEAEAVTTFLTDMFKSSQPGESRNGRDVKVAEILDKAREQLDRDLAGQPARRAKLQEALAKTYYALGLYREAIPLQEQVWQYHLAASNPKSTDLPEAINFLGVLYTAAGRQNEALEMFEKSLMLSRAVLGPEHNDTILAMQNVAISYSHVGRLDEALKLREEVLALRRKVLGPERLETLQAMGNLANSYADAGRRDEAIRMNEDVLTVSRKVCGPEHPNTLSAMNNLAISYDDAGRMDEALKLREEVLGLRRKVLGPEHPYTLRAMVNVAASYAHSGRLDESTKLLEEVLASRRKVLGPEHPETRKTMDDLAECYSGTGRRDDAIRLLEEQLIFVRALATTNPSVRESLLGKTAELHYRQKNYARAELLYREELESRRSHSGAGQGDTTIATSANLARLLCDWAWAGHTTNTVAAGAHARESESLAREAVARSATQKDLSPRLIADLQSRLGGALYTQAFLDSATTPAVREPKLIEAEKLLLQSHAALEQDPKSEGESKRDSFRRLIQLYGAWEKPAELAQWTQRLDAFEQAEAGNKSSPR